MAGTKKSKRLISNSPRPGKTLSQRVVRGGVWVSPLRMTERAPSMQTYDCDPKPCSHDFGVVRIALLATASPEISSQTGLQQPLIG